MSGGLPIGWAWATIGEVCRPVETTDPRTAPDTAFQYIDIGGIPSGAGQVRETKTLLGREAPSRARQVVRAGDTVLSTVRTYQRKTAIVPPTMNGAIASTGFSVLRPAPGIHPLFLLHQVLGDEFVELLNEKQTGTSYPAVRYKDVRAMPFRVAPPAEQERIVAALEEHLSRLDAADSALSSVSVRLQQFERSTLQSADDRKWPEREVGDLLLDIEAGKSFQTPGRPAAPDEWGVIKVSAMTWGAFDERQNKAILDTARVQDRYEIRPGDLLLSRANTSELVGATVLVERTRPRLLLSDKSMRLHPRPDIDRRWLRYCLSAPSVREQMSAAATGTSNSMRNISQAKVRQLRLHVPPFAEQQRVANQIHAQRELRARITDDLTTATERSDALRRSILSAAFSGQLVAQDLADEPASVLLERIAAEHPPHTHQEKSR